MIEDDASLPVVVVPDGLAACPETGRALAEPSFAFRAVLEHVAAHYAGRAVYLAPANAFGSPKTEQEVAREFLQRRGLARVWHPAATTGQYIDTWGNAGHLRRGLEQAGLWPLGPIILVVAFRHARRAELCFRRQGFQIAKIDRVAYEIPRAEQVVKRLFYYRWPALHACYESAAWLRDRLRPAREAE